MFYELLIAEIGSSFSTREEIGELQPHSVLNEGDLRGELIVDYSLWIQLMVPQINRDHSLG